MKQRIFNYILLPWMVILTGYIVIESRKAPPDVEFELKLNDREIMKDLEANVTNMLVVCEYYDVKHPRIVQAQAILETGNFTSEGCLVDNNLFGLYDSKRQKYYSFDHWISSVEAYVSMVQYKYKGGNDKPPNDYYKFLSDIGYAKDPDYINKLKGIVSRNDKRRSE